MSFDTLAPHYRWMEVVLAGNKLQRCRIAFLDRVRRARNVLILGEGNGRFLAECRRALPGAAISCVDASCRMLRLAQRRLERLQLSCDQVDFVHADALNWEATGREFDLIVTHFFLDCFRPEQLESLVATLAEVAAPRATWLLADFRAPRSGLGRWRAQVILAMMYVFFRLATRLPAHALTPPDPYLEEHRFTLCERRLSEWGLLHTDCWERRDA